MSIASLLLGLALLLVVALFVLRPLLAGASEPARPRGRSRAASAKRAALMAQKEGLLEEIRALEFDYETGKVPAEVYEVERARRVAAAAGILRQLDQMPGGEPSPEKRVLAQSRVSAEIEAAVARLRANSNGKAPAAPQPRYCPQCGQPTNPTDRFCAYCANPLKVVNPEE